MRDKVIKSISDFSLLDSNDNIVVALSGGADSVALLHILNSLKEQYKLTLYACHINHMIRGVEADNDESFVTQLCNKMGIQLFVKKVDVPQISKEEKISLELCGRNVRYEYFEYLSQKLKAKVATAHTASDNVETVLYNIARGTALSGLCGIKPKRDYIIRPLIGCTREDVELYCTNNSLSYVTDSTNLTDEYTRNNIRHNAVPVLRDINPQLCDTVGRMCSSLTQIKDFIDKYSLEEINKCKTEYGYSSQQLLRIDKAVLSNALCLICKQHGVDATMRHIELIIESLSDCGSMDLGFGKRAVCKQGILRIMDSQVVQESFECRFKDYESKEFISNEELKNINKNFLKNCISCDIITNDTMVRTKRQGDTFTFFERGVTKSVKKLLNELKIPQEKRSSVLLVANGSTVLWLQGVGVSKHARVHENCNGAYIIKGENNES